MGPNDGNDMVEIREIRDLTELSFDLAIGYAHSTLTEASLSVVGHVAPVSAASYQVDCAD